LGRIEAADHAENEADVRIVSDLVDEIRDAVMEYQASGDPDRFPPPLVKTRIAGTDRTTANHIQSES